MRKYNKSTRGGIGGMHRCSSLPRPLLLRLTQHLAATALGAVGDAMLHTLVSTAEEFLCDEEALHSLVQPCKPAASGKFCNRDLSTGVAICTVRIFAPKWLHASSKYATQGNMPVPAAEHRFRYHIRVLDILRRAGF